MDFLFDKVWSEALAGPIAGRASANGRPEGLFTFLGGTSGRYRKWRQYEMTNATAYDRTIELMAMRRLRGDSLRCCADTRGC